MVGELPPPSPSFERGLFAMEEIWKDVDGYEGYYQVSNLGNVKSLNWRNMGYAKNLWLKPHNKGYLQVELAKGGIKKCFVVHRLVATAFIPNPCGYPQVNHKDENKRNNCVSNLEWCNASYNAIYSLERNGVCCNGKREARRRNSSHSNQPIIQMNLDGSIVQTWDNSRTIFLETGMSDWSISECCRGKRKTAYGYKWQYTS